MRTNVNSNIRQARMVRIYMQDTFSRLPRTCSPDGTTMRSGHTTTPTRVSRLPRATSHKWFGVQRPKSVVANATVAAHNIHTSSFVNTTLGATLPVNLPIEWRRLLRRLVNAQQVVVRQVEGALTSAGAQMTFRALAIRIAEPGITRPSPECMLCAKVMAHGGTCMNASRSDATFRTTPIPMWI